MDVEVNQEEVADLWRRVNQLIQNLVEQHKQGVKSLMQDHA